MPSIAIAGLWIWAPYLIGAKPGAPTWIPLRRAFCPYRGSMRMVCQDMADHYPPIVFVCARWWGRDYKSGQWDRLQLVVALDKRGTLSAYKLHAMSWTSPVKLERDCYEIVPRLRTWLDYVELKPPRR